MTLDVTIGMRVYNDKEDVDETEREYVEQCPDAEYDVCDPKYTTHPRESYRSSGGEGILDFGEFWKKYMPELNKGLRCLYPLKSLINQIKNLPDKCGSALNNDRMKWFKFWSEKAVELYGDKAYIQFA